MPLALLSQNVPPILTATGNQIYCPGSDWMKIATGFSITDPDDTTATAVYVQISEGYLSNQDVIDFRGTMPLVWTYDPISARAEIRSLTGQPLTFSDVTYIVNNVYYKNNATNPTPGVRKFSITIGDASYLPSTGHYYRFVSSNGISWSNARQAAANSTYFGLQGYLATIGSHEEAQFVGEQTRVTGWIGGSDEQTEGVWRWVTGPEAGTVFWNGGPNGSSPNYAFWNSGEPNNADGGEDYAHITARGVGNVGSWNDLPNQGGNGDYAPKGYIVEYGGMPGDPALNIAAHTTITVSPTINTINASRCDSGSVTLQANSAIGTIEWYTNITGGTPIATGTSFTTPVLTSTTTYYAALAGSCSNTRKPVTATITIPPTVTVMSPAATCSGTPATLQAVPSGGTVSWYTTAIGGTPFATGSTVTAPAVTADTIFYAETTVAGCQSVRLPVQVIVSSIPAVIDEVAGFCEGSSVTLDAGLPGMAYTWLDGTATQTITVQDAGIYAVTVTNPAGCSAIKTFTVNKHSAPVIASVNVNGRTVTISLINVDVQNYEFSIDGINYQASNIFTDVESGLGKVRVRETHYCGNAEETFIVYIIPAFFSPNQDSYNDYFTIEGLMHYPNATVTIFDRYGKLVTRLSRKKRSWDGTFNSKPMPASDYWYIIKLDENTPEIKGHFSLVR